MFRLATTVSYFYYLLRLISSAVVIGVPVSRPVGEFFCFGGQTKTVASERHKPDKNVKLHRTSASGAGTKSSDWSIFSSAFRFITDDVRWIFRDEPDWKSKNLV